MILVSISRRKCGIKTSGYGATAGRSRDGCTAITNVAGGHLRKGDEGELYVWEVIMMLKHV